MITVLKNNILVKPIILEDKEGRLNTDKNVQKKNVDTRLNSGVVVSVSKRVDGVKVGDVVGYSTYDGVNVKYNNELYILLSERETQAVILDVENVKFGTHNRDEIDEYVFKQQLIATDRTKL